MTMAVHQTARFAAPKSVQGSVLLIEDDLALARCLVHVMNAEGFHVVHVPSGAGAVEKMMNHAFDAVISDLNLPGASGVDILNVVRAYDPDMPLVLMTGAPTVDTAIEACSLGVLEYLVKPTRRDQIVRVLGRVKAARRAALNRLEASEEAISSSTADTADTVRPSALVSELPATVPSVPSVPAMTAAALVTVAATLPAPGLTLRPDGTEDDAARAAVAMNDTQLAGPIPSGPTKSETPTVTLSAVSPPLPAERPLVPASARSAVSGVGPMNPMIFGSAGTLSNGGCPSLRTTFERAMLSLEVDLEPIADARTKTLIGFAARMGSKEETLTTEAALVVAAEHLGCLEALRRRVRDLAVKAFVAAPPGVMLFVDVHPSDLMDGELYSPEPPLARIAERVVLQVRARGLAIEDLAARASVLRFVGFRLAIADLDAGQACLAQIADLSPEFVKIDARLVRAMDRSAGRRRLVSALVSMCKTLDAVAIAEGVSTAEEREALLEAGCAVVQGPIAGRHVTPSKRPGVISVRDQR
jgi:EAL domain-containing protein (putative c-di-GMP-specific phosphodiesterase class I)/ActR/RegA family two-component response regulator